LDRSELLNDLLRTPTAPALPGRQADPEKDFTRQIEVSGDAAEVTVRGPEGIDPESTAADVLRAHHLDPAEWEVTGFRSSEWTMASGEPGVSARFSFGRRKVPAVLERPDIDELLAVFDEAPGFVQDDVKGEFTYVVALGDMQFGKVDGDGYEGTLKRAMHCIDRAADLLVEYQKRFDIEHVHLAWLGDHVEGFVSQGGANVWRTQLTLTEQIRLTRRLMAHAIIRFAPMASRLTVVAVPGNHGEAVRPGGKGVTRYDDSHDTDALISVSEALSLAGEEFAHVEVYVPDTDELTVVVECSGTVVAHAHGHQWRPGKHFEWWRGQAFDKTSAMHTADLLLAGHLHHEFVDTDGPRTFIQVPAMESESTWWRHMKGTRGAPGLMVMVTKDGDVPVKEVVR
jgi:predicted phosphodiesterase